MTVLRQGFRLYKRLHPNFPDPKRPALARLAWVWSEESEMIKLSSPQKLIQCHSMIIRNFAIIKKQHQDFLLNNTVIISQSIPTNRNELVLMMTLLNAQVCTPPGICQRKPPMNLAHQSATVLFKSH